MSDATTDASFMFNILSTNRARRLLEVVELRLILPPKVHAEMTQASVVLDELIEVGRVQIVELSTVGMAQYAVAAASVDDGAAQAIALGLTRGIEFVTDDGCAMDTWVAMSHSAGTEAVRVRGICEILQLAEASVSLDDLRDALVRISRDASFDPPSPQSIWWSRILSCKK